MKIRTKCCRDKNIYTYIKFEILTRVWAKKPSTSPNNDKIIVIIMTMILITKVVVAVVVVEVI